MTRKRRYRPPSMTYADYVQWFRSMTDPAIGPHRTPCELWTGAIMPNGYGRLRVFGGQAMYAHREAYAIAYGTPPPDRLVCHHLDCHRHCCNPQHLYLGTHKDNNHDWMIREGWMEVAA